MFANGTLYSNFPLHDAPSVIASFQYRKFVKKQILNMLPEDVAVATKHVA